MIIFIIITNMFICLFHVKFFMNKDDFEFKSGYKLSAAVRDVEGNMGE